MQRQRSHDLSLANYLTILRGALEIAADRVGVDQGFNVLGHTLVVGEVFLLLV